MSPYPGLRAFRRDEAELFFGREASIDAMVDRLAATRFLAVVGTSGSGKSSLVRAGLVDALELGYLRNAGSTWMVADFRPGRRPLRNLAEALIAIRAPSASTPDGEEIGLLAAFLARGPRSLVEWCAAGNIPQRTNLLILVDQFEELFRQAGDSGPEEMAAFVALLLESARAPLDEARIHVALTMRSEYIGATALIEGLAEAVNTGLHVPPRMGRQAARDAILGPAGVRGFEVEPVLLNRLLNDITAFAPSDEPGAGSGLQQIGRRADQLPLLQHVLNRLWTLAADRGDEQIILALDDYLAAGGLAGTIETHGREILDELLPEHRLVAPAVFRALVSGTSPADAGRKPTEFRELVAIAGGDEVAVRELIEAFRAPGRNFLLPGRPVPLRGGTLVELTHESLIRQWGQLGEWLRQEIAAAAVWRRIAAQAERHEHGEASLLTGPALASLADWWDAEEPNAAWARRHGGEFRQTAAFLAASRAAEAAQAEMTGDERRQKSRWRSVAKAAAVILFVVAPLAGLAGYSAWRANLANHAASLAEATAAEARLAAAAAHQDALAAAVDADAARKHADEERKRALDSANAAEAERQRAEAARQEVASAQAEVRAERRRAEMQGRRAADLAAAVDAERQRTATALANAESERQRARVQEQRTIEATAGALDEKRRAADATATAMAEKRRADEAIAATEGEKRRADEAMAAAATQRERADQATAAADREKANAERATADAQTIRQRAAEAMAGEKLAVQQVLHWRDHALLFAGRTSEPSSGPEGADAAATVGTLESHVSGILAVDRDWMLNLLALAAERERVDGSKVAGDGPVATADPGGGWYRMSAYGWPMAFVSGALNIGQGGEAAKQCDLLAADPYDAGRRAPGVPLERIDAGAAEAECRAEHEANPGDARVTYQLARAMSRDPTRGDEFLSLARKAADQGVSAAYVLIADTLETRQDDHAAEAYAAAAQRVIMESFPVLYPWLASGKADARGRAGLTWLAEKAAALGVPEAHFALAELLDDPIVKQVHYELAARLWAEAGKGVEAAKARDRATLIGLSAGGTDEVATRVAGWTPESLVELPADVGNI